MRNILLVLVFIILFPSITNAAEVVKLYPVEDGVTQLYDGEGQVDWISARNYQGTFSRQPITDDFFMAVRSDKQSGYYRFYRLSMVFDTSELPDGAVIESAVVNLYKYPFANNHADTDLVLTSHSRSVGDALKAEDWYMQNFITEFSRGLLQDNQYTQYVLNNEGVDYINLNDKTAIGILSEFDFDDVPQGGWPTGGAFYAMEIADESLRPYLEITYTVPEVEKTLVEHVAELEAYIDSLALKSVRNSYTAHVKKIVGLFEAGEYETALEQMMALQKKIERDGIRGNISEADLAWLEEATDAIVAILEASQSE